MDTDRPVLAKKVSTDSLEECGHRLRQGQLVAFPTETVYGLGCHALDPEAVNKVFKAKERPLTDPLIVHVSDPEDAYKLWDTDGCEEHRLAVRALCERFWPGPLTLVAKAKPQVPSIIMANTGFVACRCPSHPVARSLIETAKVPLAAPSANKFGHVSPTKPDHVWDDLQHEDVWILEENGATALCEVGVESTVAKLEGSKLTVLRQGAVSVAHLGNCLSGVGLGNIVVESASKRATPDHIPTVAPGQTIRHYSPHIPSYMLSRTLYAKQDRLSEDNRNDLASSVVIDVGGRLKSWRDFALEYRDLSETGDSAEAAQAVFEVLRWAERVEGASRILFPELDETDDALTLAVKDRLTRAASGVVIDKL